MSTVLNFLPPKVQLELFTKGQDLFNDELFFEAHEEWEALWKKESESNKIFVQALIQIAGHFVHLQKQNYSGAKSLAEAALEKLDSVSDQKLAKLYTALDLTPFFAALDYNLSLLRQTQVDLSFKPEFAAFVVPKLMTID